MIVRDYRFLTQVKLQLTAQELRHCVVVARQHYDWRCKQWGHKFLEPWLKMVLFNSLPEDKTLFYQWWLDWDDVDTLCKILEQEHWETKVTGIEIYSRITNMFREMRRKSQEANAAA